MGSAKHNAKAWSGGRYAAFTQRLLDSVLGAPGDTSGEQRRAVLGRAAGAVLTPLSQRERGSGGEVPKRDFLQITDFSRKEVQQLFELSTRMKARGYRETPLAGKTLAMIFAKSSTRTRVSFEVGAYQLGGRALFLSSKDIQIGRGEPIPDTARVLSRYVDGIMIRTFDHAEVEELARYATIPVTSRSMACVAPTA